MGEQVKRYDVFAVYAGPVVESESPTGEFVKHSDHVAALQSEADALRREVEALKWELSQARDEAHLEWSRAYREREILAHERDCERAEREHWSNTLGRIAAEMTALRPPAPIIIQQATREPGRSEA